MKAKNEGHVQIHEKEFLLPNGSALHAMNLVNLKNCKPWLQPAVLTNHGKSNINRCVATKEFWNSLINTSTLDTSKIKLSQERSNKNITLTSKYHADCHCIYHWDTTNTKDVVSKSFYHLGPYHLYNPNLLHLSWSYVSTIPLL